MLRLLTVRPPAAGSALALARGDRSKHPLEGPPPRLSPYGLEALGGESEESDAHSLRRAALCEVEEHREPVPRKGVSRGAPEWTTPAARHSPLMAARIILEAATRHETVQEIMSVMWRGDAGCVAHVGEHG